jgi:hypothetical protein
MNLAEREKNLSDAGFSQKEIADWKKEKIEKLNSAGFTNSEILESFGTTSNDKKVYQNYFSDIKKEIINEYEQQEIVSPDDEMLYQSKIEQGDPLSLKEVVVGDKFNGDDILKRGYGKTLYDMTTRLATGKGLSEALIQPEPQDYTWFEGLLERAYTLGLELPIYGLSFIPGNLAGGPYGGAFTAGAIPAAARETILKGLEQQSYGEPISIVKNFLQEGIKEGAKQGLTFALTAAAPQLRVGGTKLADQYITRVASQLTAFEGVGATLNQQLPTLKEFSYSAALFSAFGLVQPRKTMEDRAKKIFVDTGKKPNQIFSEAITNKRILEDVSSRSYIRDYANLVKEKITKPKVEKDKPIFKDDLANKASENIVLKPRVEPLTVERLKEMGSTVKRKAIVEGIDNKYPILETMRKAGVNTKTGIEKLNLYEQARIMEGMPNRAAYFIEYNTLNAKTLGDRGIGLKEITKDIVKEGKNNTQLFETYLSNRRAIELNNRGIETGFNIDVSKQFVNKYKNTFESKAKQTDKYQRELLEYARDGGLITKDAYTAMTEANKNYVTFARELIQDGKPVVAEGSVNPFKPIKGAKLRVYPPLEQMVKNTNTIVNAVERNKVKINFLDLVAKAKKKDPNSFKDINKVNPRTTKKPKEDLMTVRKEGKLETWDVGKDIKTAFTTLDQQGSNMLYNYLGAPARTLRAGAILIPDFAVPNFFRDTMQASFLNKVGFVPIQDSVIGAFNIITKGNRKKTMEMYKKYVKSGGMQSTLLAVDKPNIFDGKVYDILSKGPVRNSNRGMLAPFRALTQLSEEMTRFRIFEKTYKKAIEKGLTEKQAIERGGFEARNLLDYAKRGSLGNNINRLVPFWNARVQGLTRLYEAFRDQPGRTTAMIGAYVAIPTIGFYMLNYDDADYRDEPEWLKQNYYYFKINDKPYRFPKPFEVGTLVSSVIEKSLDWIRTNEPQEWSKFAGQFFINNAKGFYPIPTSVRPLAENLADYSIFRDAPIIPKSLDKNLSNKFYYTEYTSETIKLFSEILNGIVGDDSFLSVKPLHAENVFRSWTGGLGRYALDILDFALIKSKIIDDPIKPTDTLSKIPVVRAFDVRDVPGYSSTALTTFFKKLDPIQKAFNDIEFAKKIGDVEEVERLVKAAPLDKKFMLDYANSIKDLDKSIRQIYNVKELADGTTITGDQKRELIDQQYILMINFAKQALNLLENMEDK